MSFEETEVERFKNVASLNMDLPPQTFTGHAISTFRQLRGKFACLSFDIRNF